MVGVRVRNAGAIVTRTVVISSRVGATGLVRETRARVVGRAAVGLRRHFCCGVSSSHEEKTRCFSGCKLIV
jgi:hypothetical protein